MKIRPLHDNVIIKRLEDVDKTKGGIIIPDSAKEKPIHGLIVAVGPGKTLKGGKKVSLDVSKGDKVLFAKWAGNEIKIDGEEHLIMSSDEILAIVK